MTSGRPPSATRTRRTTTAQHPSIDVEKYVSIDGGASWVDADTATGPYLTTGIDPQFKFVIENIGNVDLTDVDLIDSVFGNIHLDGTLAVAAIETYNTSTPIGRPVST